jgi:hypothetical protein
MSGMYFTNDDDGRSELDYRRAEAIGKIASFAPKLYELERLHRYVTQYQRPDGDGEDYEAPAERRRRAQEERDGKSSKIHHYDALSEMTGELLRRTAQTLPVPQLERLARRIEAEVEESRRQHRIEQQAKSASAASGPVETAFQNETPSEAVSNSDSDLWT